MSRKTIEKKLDTKNYEVKMINFLTKNGKKHKSIKIFNKSIDLLKKKN